MLIDLRYKQEAEGSVFSDISCVSVSEAIPMGK